MNQTPLPSRPTPTRTIYLLVILLAAGFVVLLGTPSADAAPAVTAPTIVPFSDWAPAACPAPTGADRAPSKRLVVHHTHEPVAHTPAEVLPALALTCKAHTDRGFSTIGYHYVVDPWGGVYQGRGLLPDKHGRPPKVQPQGAHVAGSNAGAVGVVFLGDHEGEPPTAAALISATRLLAWLMQDIGTNPGATVATESSGVGTARFNGTFHPRAVTGHSASNHTACPGEHLRALLSPIRNEMRRLIAGDDPEGWAGMEADGLVKAAPEPAEPAKQSKQSKSDKAGTGQDHAGHGHAQEARGEETRSEKARGENARGENARDEESRGQKAKAEKAAPAEPVAEQAAEVAESTPLALGPLASPVQKLARGLREVGLLSLAERFSGASDG